MTSHNPNILMQDFDAIMRRAQRDVTKALTLADRVRGARDDKRREKPLLALEARLHSLEAALNPAFVTQWRQDHTEPRERQEAPGLPHGLICKKCGNERPEQDFFYDDGLGGYGYTHRCVACRRSGRKEAARSGNQV